MLRPRQAEGADPLLNYIIFTVVELIFGKLRVSTMQDVPLIGSASIPLSAICLIVYPYLSTGDLSVDGLHVKGRNVQAPFFIHILTLPSFRPLSLFTR